MKLKRNVFWALPFIYVGIIWQSAQMGYITSHLSHILISWQVLLIYIGVWSLINGHRILPGIVAILAGGLFLLPETGLVEEEWAHLNWPLALILIGILVLVKPFFPGRKIRQHRLQINPGRGTSNYVCTEGYIESVNTFGSIEQIVLDPVFKGAQLKNTFGGIVLDLRRTRLEAPQTFIDVECTFGGIEIYVPANWNMQTQVKATIGGCENKRYTGYTEIDHEHVLIIRGNITFGGLELKS